LGNKKKSPQKLFSASICSALGLAFLFIIKLIFPNAMKRNCLLSMITAVSRLLCQDFDFPESVHTYQSGIACLAFLTESVYEHVHCSICGYTCKIADSFIARGLVGYD
jgi:hypothetical protein